MWARSWVGGGAAEVWSSWPKLDNRISQLISDHLTGLYHNYFVIISSVILCLNFERRLLTSVHHFKPSRFLSKLPRSFQEMTVNPSLPSNCLADCPLPSRAVTRHRWWKSPAGAGRGTLARGLQWPNTLRLCTLCWYTWDRIGHICNALKHRFIFCRLFKTMRRDWWQSRWPPGASQLDKTGLWHYDSHNCQGLNVNFQIVNSVI